MTKLLESVLACHQLVIFIQKSSFTQGLSCLEVTNAIMISLVVTIGVYFTRQSGWFLFLERETRSDSYE